jgi:hypothetical protein
MLVGRLSIAVYHYRAYQLVISRQPLSMRGPALIALRMGVS